MNNECNTFTNDYSSEWLRLLVGTRGVTRLMAPHNQLLSQPDSIDLALCWQVLASAEVVAACYSQNHDRIPDVAKQWLNRRQGLYARRCKITKEQADKAHSAVTMALQWQGLKEWCCCHACGQAWQQRQQELLQRLAQPTSMLSH
ncbi:hypothetical protein [uncultured Ferrimonas sp.]|uniref:hypothetical protein n=1 Tax=uncultured Ferrimonas sp. TaxID=432640 RepID=UPI002604BE7B|nr:hypothetical protein [uncultured Ferrimonas sp.]